MELGSTRLDQSAVREGVWTEFVIKRGNREAAEISLKLALADASLNKAYKEALKKALEPHERMLAIYKKGSDIPEALAKKVNDAGALVFAQMIVQDWKGPTKKGAALPYSPEACLKLFEEFPELREQAEAEAAKHERYRVAVLEEAGGNSQTA
jgi:hypothetical protein